jgi:hypothetical protein
MDHFSDIEGPLPDIYRSREAFFASLPAWRRFLAKLNWHPTIDIMVHTYQLQQAAARRDQALAARASSMSGNSATSTLASSPRPERPAPPASRRLSWRNGGKATLLLLLGIGIAILLFRSGIAQLLLLASIPAFLVVAVLGFLWQAIYDTLQEGDQPPPP